MLFDGRSLSDLSIEDIRALVEDHVSEGPNLYYRQTPYGHSDNVEMLRDIMALTNAEGGYLVLGVVKGNGGRAERFEPIDDPGHEVARMRQIGLDGFSERIDGIEMRSYDFGFNQGIIMIRVPPSWRAPHLMTPELRTDFYTRYGIDKRSMTIAEVHDTILLNPYFRQMIGNMVREANTLVGGISADQPDNELAEQTSVQVVSEIINEGATDRGWPSPVLLYTERSVERFLQRYLMGGMLAQVLVIVSPFIGDLSESIFNLKSVMKKAKADRTRVYVVTQPPVEKYHVKGLALLGKYPNIEIRYNPDVHAKLYICWSRDEAESFALFGSGNLTQSGLKHNIELGMMVLARGYGRKLVRELYQWASCTLRSTSERVKAITS